MRVEYHNFGLRTLAFGGKAIAIKSFFKTVSCTQVEKYNNGELNSKIDILNIGIKT